MSFWHIWTLVALALFNGACAMRYVTEAPLLSLFSAFVCGGLCVALAIRSRK